jgi:hypothetical protein
MVRGNNVLAIQKHLETAYFVLAWSVSVSDRQYTAALRHGIDAKVFRSSAWLIGGTCLEDLHIYALRITCEILRRAIRAYILSRNKCGSHKTEASYPRELFHAGYDT